MRTLLLEIELPGFYVGEDDSDEDIEESMHLANERVVVVFAGHEGDSPGVWLRTLEGNITRFGTRDASSPASNPEVVYPGTSGPTVWIPASRPSDG